MGDEVVAIVSEDKELIIHTANHQAKYVVAIDPLDGSSNIDKNVSIGTIFSIYQRVTPVGAPPELIDFLQGSRRQVAAGYILYGSTTMLVYATGHGVNGFTYDPSQGEFFLSHDNIRCPQAGMVYSCNEGYVPTFSDGVQHYLHQCRNRSYSAAILVRWLAIFTEICSRAVSFFIRPPQKPRRVSFACCMSVTHWLI